METTNRISEDERDLLNHVILWGSDGNPIDRIGAGKWSWSFRSLKPSKIWKTRREAVANLESFLDAIRDRIAGRV
jgi:hypothetical protein